MVFIRADCGFWTVGLAPWWLFSGYVVFAPWLRSWPTVYFCWFVSANPFKKCLFSSMSKSGQFLYELLAREPFWLVSNGSKSRFILLGLLLDVDVTNVRRGDDEHLDYGSIKRVFIS